MTSITIQSEPSKTGTCCYRAFAGSHHSMGRTPGEALDALIATEGDTIESSTILIQRFAPDSHFSQAQYDRMRVLLGRNPSLYIEERKELEELVNAELDATVSRSQALLSRIKS